jgi:hypothetical protein
MYLKKGRKKTVGRVHPWINRGPSLCAVVFIGSNTPPSPSSKTTAVMYLSLVTLSSLYFTERVLTIPSDERGRVEPESFE